MFYSVKLSPHLLFSSFLFLLPVYIYSGTTAAPLPQVKALCMEREINSEQLEMGNSLAMFIILPSVLFCGSAGEIWMNIQYLT